MICKKINKLLAVMLMCVMIISLFCFNSAYALEDKSAKILLKADSKTVLAGQNTTVDVVLDFNETEIINTGGIMTVRCEIAVDSEKLQFVDPYTRAVIEFDENGNVLTEGAKLFKPGELGPEGLLSAKYYPSSDFK